MLVGTPDTVVAGASQLSDNDDTGKSSTLLEMIRRWTFVKDVLSFILRLCEHMIFELEVELHNLPFALSGL